MDPGGAIKGWSTRTYPGERRASFSRGINVDVRIRERGEETLGYRLVIPQMAADACDMRGISLRLGLCVRSVGISRTIPRKDARSPSLPSEPGSLRLAF